MLIRLYCVLQKQEQCALPRGPAVVSSCKLWCLTHKRLFLKPMHVETANIHQKKSHLPMQKYECHTGNNTSSYQCTELREQNVRA